MQQSSSQTEVQSVLDKVRNNHRKLERILVDFQQQTTPGAGGRKERVSKRKMHTYLLKTVSIPRRQRTYLSPFPVCNLFLITFYRKWYVCMCNMEKTCEDKEALCYHLGKKSPMQTNWRKKSIQHNCSGTLDGSIAACFRVEQYFQIINMEIGLSITPNNWREPSNAKTFCKECVL